MENSNNYRTLKQDVVIDMSECLVNNNSDDDIVDFFNSNYASSIKTFPKIKDKNIVNTSNEKSHHKTPCHMDENKKYLDMDIKVSIGVNLLEAYHGCIKEKTINRSVYVNNTFMRNEEETICIEINDGVLNNEHIVIDNKGHCHSKTHDIYEPSKYYGNLIITVKLEEKLYVSSLFNMLGIPMEQMMDYNISGDDYYSKNENDLRLTKHITLKDALCGYRFILPHLSKKILKMNSSQTITYPDKIVIVPLYGFVRNDKTGSLIIQYKIVFPLSLNSQQKQLIKTLL